jgi:hypothetical protein
VRLGGSISTTGVLGMDTLRAVALIELCGRHRAAITAHEELQLIAGRAELMDVDTAHVIEFAGICNVLEEMAATAGQRGCPDAAGEARRSLAALRAELRRLRVGPTRSRASDLVAAAQERAKDPDQIARALALTKPFANYPIQGGFPFAR